MLQECAGCGAPLFEWMDCCRRCQKSNPWARAADSPFDRRASSSHPGESDLHAEKLLLVYGVGGVLLAGLSAIGSMPVASAPTLSRVGSVASAVCAAIGLVSLFLYHRLDVARLVPTRRRILRVWLVVAGLTLAAVLALLQRA